jgi:malate dehydrogenase (oxaloacetate-decarboxylating)(NADP+)
LVLRRKGTSVQDRDEKIEMAREQFKKAALEYHEEGRPGKVSITPTKPCVTQRDLSLAYSPGVAFPCLEIAKNENDVYRYTNKGNLVAVISNGTAVLGLGNIGAAAGKPVMEGKGVLFKKFADIDVFDIEINAMSVESIVQVVTALEPTFGGINLEDIKAPECFEVERQCQEKMNIPVFHDDQHGTAIIASAGFLNALEVVKKKINKVKVVFSGAGAASIACARLFIKLGVLKENLFMTDSQGVIYEGRKDGMNPYKQEFANHTKDRTLEDVMNDADVFIGCSARGVLTKAMVKTMAKKPIIFAMANPDPEILPEEVAEVRDDAIMATGRSDYPNQVNNVLGFPFIFRGALDVRAKKINEEMKLAAVYALAKLAKEEVPDEVKEAYGNEDFSFGKDYLIPKPFDSRALTRVAPAVAKAAMDTGVARIQIPDLHAYSLSLMARLHTGLEFVKQLRDRLHKKHKPRIIYPEGTNARILGAMNILRQENLIEPILIGKKDIIHAKMSKMGLDNLKDIEIIDPKNDPRYESFAHTLFEARQRKGVSFAHAHDLMEGKNYFSCMFVKEGYADAMITGTSQNYPECVKPVMRVIGVQANTKAAGVIILVYKNKILFLADCTMQINPDAAGLSNIAISTIKLYQELMLRDPKVAFLSYSNFGSNESESPLKVAKAVHLTKEKMPHIVLDGEIQADVAVNNKIRKSLFNFSTLDGEADVLIFPDLNSANIGYKLLAQLSEATPIGPILIPTNKAVNIVQRTSTINEIVNMSIVTALMAQHLTPVKKSESKKGEKK